MLDSKDFKGTICMYMNYKHTQIGYLMLWVMFALVLLYGFIFISAEFDFATLVSMLLVLLILASFSTLTVMIDNDYLKIKFGYGIYRKRFLLKDIVSVKTVKNHWYYGWGIRLCLWSRMHIYNISGFDAIEIVMADGKIYRIGTDEPKELEQAILQSRG